MWDGEHSSGGRLGEVALGGMCACLHKLWLVLRYLIASCEALALLPRAVAACMKYPFVRMYCFIGMGSSSGRCDARNRLPNQWRWFVAKVCQRHIPRKPGLFWYKLYNYFRCVHDQSKQHRGEVKDILPNVWLLEVWQRLFQTSFALCVLFCEDQELTFFSWLFQVVMAAIFDLLTSQCDRIPNNVFIDEEGHISLIDNTDGLGNGHSCHKHRMLSSVFLPRTAANVLQIVKTKKQTLRTEIMSPKYPRPLAMMDYRYVYSVSQSTQVCG